LNNNGTSPQETPVVDQLILGQANATLPVFAVLKFKTVLLHLIISTKRKQLCKPKIAMQVVNYYARLYKAQKQ
jgi:hypothetical protein